MFKKTFLVSTAAILISFLASCSLVNSPDNSGSVTLTLSRSAARNADSDLETLYVDVSLKGDYSETQTIIFQSGSTKETATFDQIKPKSKVYIEANAYTKDPTSGEKNYEYTVKSDTIKIKSGENNISLTLKKLYSVWFELNGGSGDFKTQRVVSGEKAIRPETDPTKEATEDCAYEFAGWYTSDDVKFDFDKPIKKDTILYAKWNEKHIFTVTFDSNNGDNEPFATERIVEGKSVSEPENHPEKEGTEGFAYVFSGWYKSIDDETPFDFNTPIEESITLYAKWITKQWFTVTFKADIDADEDFDTARVLEGNKVSAPETNPTKAETAEKIYTFDCWVTADDEAFDFDTPITGNITLYARYTEKNIYTVTFDSDNGATSAFATEKVIEGNKVSRPDTDPVRTDTEDEKFQFAGWYTSKGTAFDFNTEITDNITLIAHYAVTHIYKVSFNLNGGEGTFETQRITEGEKATRPSTEPTRENTATAEYTFGGWYTSTDNGETISDEPFDFDTPITGNLTLYAFWNSTEKFTVSFNVNGGTGNFESQNVTNGEKATEPTTQPTKEGDENTKYTFIGWYTSSDEGKTLSETPFDFAKTKITKSITLYAKLNLQFTSSIYVEIPYENVTKEMLITSMRGQEGGTWEITAKEGYDSYTWKWDGVTQSEYNNKIVFITPTAIKGGTYTVSLLVTKIIDGETKYYSETTQVTREQ